MMATSKKCGLAAHTSIGAAVAVALSLASIPLAHGQDGAAAPDAASAPDAAPDSTAAPTSASDATAPSTANASTASAANGPGRIEEVQITGSRIARDGYSAPTPLTVVGAEQVQQQATNNVIDFLTEIPSFSGNYTPQSSTQNVSSGTAGTSSVNLRNLGTNRTLVLMNGQRIVPSTITGLVDVNTIPDQLIQRVEVVTGGASAAYGSDAVSGVVNFILDKKFNGLKAEVSGGETSYGDDRSYKGAITFGTGFADNRGHLILSAGAQHQDGVLFGNRPWNQTGWQIINNPAYTATNGLPRRLLLPQVAAATATPGGIIVNGPLRGTAFGPQGTPYAFNYGPIVSGDAMQGGDWQTTSLHTNGQSIEPRMTAQNIFARASFDLTDSVELFVQSSYYSNKDFSHAYPNEFFGGLTVSASNPFLPASVAAGAAALGLPTITMGTSNADMGIVSIDTRRHVLRNVIGLDGQFGALNTQWSWDAYYQYGVSRSTEQALNTLNFDNFDLALDSVINPATGSIVCRSTLTAPNNGCIPYNPFGIGVNSPAAVDYVLGTAQRHQRFEQDVGAASIRGNPINDWAGPVSVAAGIEHRKESARGDSTALDQQAVFFAGNYRPTRGSYSVTEEFLETVVPLARDIPFFKSFDLNGAVRFTDYSTSGSVTTWKVGATWSITDDVAIRATRSRDIRAPNINDLFNAGSRVNDKVIDDATGQSVAYEGTTSGNPNLKPEVATSSGIGVVFTPTFLRGFNAAVDYWNIDLKDAINTVTAQQIVDLCYQGDADFCTAINGGAPLRPTGGSDRNSILLQPFNLAQQLVRGVDVEASYQRRLSELSDSLNGTAGLRVLGTRYLKNYTNNTLTLPTDAAGQNYTTPGSVPKLRLTATLSYALSPFNASLTARYVSPGVYGNAFVECTTGCPTATIEHPTINDNHIPGATFFDAAFDYQLPAGNSQVDVFANIRNILNRDPAIAVGGPSNLPYDTVTTNPSLYDTLGRVYRVGIRVKF